MAPIGGPHDHSARSMGTPGLDFATLPLPQRALRRRRCAAVRPGNLGVPGCLLPFPKPGSHSSLQNCPSPVNSFLQVSHRAIVESSTRPVYATTTVQAHATRLSCEEAAHRQATFMYLVPLSARPDSTPADESRDSALSPFIPIRITLACSVAAVIVATLARGSRIERLRPRSPVRPPGRSPCSPPGRRSRSGTVAGCAACSLSHCCPSPVVAPREALLGSRLPRPGWVPCWPVVSSALASSKPSFGEGRAQSSLGNAPHPCLPRRERGDGSRRSHLRVSPSRTS